jgi:probable HAF family extracellular repeat protein
VGSSITASNLSHAFLYSGGQMIDLGTLGGNQPGWSTTAAGINGVGQVVGYSYLPSGDFHGFLYDNGVMHDLGTLGGDWSQAHAINAAGQITGQAYLPRNTRAHAFLYAGGVMQDLGAFHVYSSGLAINSAGVVVGSADVRNNTGFLVYHAVVYRNGAPVDLNKLIPSRSGWVLSEATGINDAGQIVGNGTLRGVQHGFVLTPQ